MPSFEKALDLIFPPTCEKCGKVGKYICDGCYNELKKYEIQNKYNSRAYYMYQYKDVIREMLINYKFNEKSYLCNLWAELILKNKNACSFLENCDIIIPVPLHRKRKMERGYNQTQLVTKQLEKQLNLIVNNKVLKKTKNIKPQSEKGYIERKEDIKGAYIVKNNKYIINKTVLVFDDIYTTGSTTNECKKTLLKAGAKSIKIFAIAKD